MFSLARLLTPAFGRPAYERLLMTGSHAPAEFHLACVDQWLTTRRPFCPVCKRDAHSTNPVPPPSESTPLLAPLLRSPSLVTPRSGGTSNAVQTPPHATVQIEGLEEAASRTGRGEGSLSVGSGEAVRRGEIEGELSTEGGGDASGEAVGGDERPALVAAATQTTSSSP